MDRRLCSNIPMTRQQRQPEIPDSKAVRERDKQLKSNQKRNFDNHHGARNLDPLSTGQLVWVPDARVEARIEEQVAPRSYTFNTPGGQTRRNRRDLIPLPTEPATPTEELLETRSIVLKGAVMLLMNLYVGVADYLILRTD